eukprot:1635669-Amphidinium_carterae.2
MLRGPASEGEFTGEEALYEMLTDVPNLPKTIQKRMPGLEKFFLQCLHTGVVMTTSFSGLGAPEIAAEMLTTAFKHEVGGLHGRWSGIESYSACDILPHCRQMLCNKKSSAPRHVFMDVLDRLDEASARKLRRVQSLTFEGCEPCSGEEELVAKNGGEVLSLLHGILGDATFQEKAWCEQHDSMCNIKPILQGRIHCEVAGVTCVAWSGMNRGRFRSWYHASAISCMTEAYSIRHYGPSLVIIECVKGFDEAVFMEVLCRDNLYNQSAIVFSPVDVGIPSMRTRKYTIAWNVQVFMTLEMQKVRAQSLFGRMFGRKLRVGAEIFLAESSASKKKSKARLAEQKNLTLSQEEISKLPWQVVLPGGLNQRLRGYEDLYSSALSSGATKLSSAWVDLKQTVGFMPRVTDTVPTLLRGNRVWDLVQSRPVMLREKFLSMGFPIPNLRYTPYDADQKECQALMLDFWPWPELDLDDPEQLSMCEDMLGNSMHLNAIGYIIFFALTFGIYKDEDAELLEAYMEVDGE